MGIAIVCPWGVNGVDLESTEPCRCYRIPVAREIVEDRGPFCGAGMADEGLAAEAALERLREHLTELGRQIRLLRCNSRWRIDGRTIRFSPCRCSRARSHTALQSDRTNRRKAGSRLPFTLRRMCLRDIAAHGVVSDPALQRRMIRGCSPRKLRHLQFQPISRRDRAFHDQVGADDKERDFCRMAHWRSTAAATHSAACDPSKKDTRCSLIRV